MADAVRMALARGPEVALAQAEAERAADAIREMRALNLPQVVTGTGLAYNNGFPLSIEGAAPSIVQLGLSQSIFSRKNKNLILEAEKGKEAGQAGYDAARNGLAARTILFYGELHQARLALPLLEKQQEAATRNLNIVESLLQAGKVRPIEADQAKFVSRGIEQQMLVARERVRLAETGLRALTGLPGNDAIRTETPELRSDLLSAPIDAMYQRALEAHPEIREAESSLLARQFHVEAEKAERLPQLNVVGQYALFSKTNNYQEFFNRFTRNNYLLGLSVQFPIFNGFRTDARVAQSRHDVDIARLRLERLKSDLRLDLDQCASALRIAIGAVEMARLDAALQEDRVKVNETLSEAGRFPPAELEGSRALLLEKRAAILEADRVRLERQVALLRAVGILHTIF
jgi:outer membrane protein